MKVQYRVTFKRLHSVFTVHPRLILALIGVLTLGALVGAVGTHSAKAATAQTYIVQVGAGGEANAALLQFAPGSLKVHRGDTVTWLITSFHNVHVGATKPVDLIIAPEVNGKPLPQANPQVFFPYGPKSGSAYQGGEAGSGVPLPLPGAPPPSPAFSLVIDVKPGTAIAYLCDIHPGMAGSLIVVDDSETIPSPAEVAVQAVAEFGASGGAATQAADKMETDSAKMMASADGKAAVQMGYDVGRAAILQFFPNTTVIKAGENVTWKFGESAIEPHTVSMPPQRGGEIVPIPQEGKPPILSIAPGSNLVPMTQSGATIKNGDKFSSGLMVPIPGKLPTFTLIFADPGVYPYVCNVHRGMYGVVVVMPK